MMGISYKSIVLPLLLTTVGFSETFFRINNLSDSTSEYFSLDGRKSNPIHVKCIDKSKDHLFKIIKGNELFYIDKKIILADTILFQKSIGDVNFCIVKKWYNKKNSPLSILRFLISHPIQVEDITLVKITPTNEQKNFKLKEVKLGINWNVEYCND